MLSMFLTGFSPNQLQAQDCPTISVASVEGTCLYHFTFTPSKPTVALQDFGFDYYLFEFGDGSFLEATNGEMDDIIPAGASAWGTYSDFFHQYCGPLNGDVTFTYTYTDDNDVQVSNTCSYSIPPIPPDCGCNSGDCDFVMTPNQSCSKLSVDFHAISNGTHQYFVDGNLVQTTTSQDWTYTFENFNNCNGNSISVTHNIVDAQNNVLCTKTESLILPQQGVFIGNQDCSSIKISELVNLGILPPVEYTASCPIYVTGEIIIDQNYSFEGATMLFDRGAGLTVSDVNGIGGTLKINDGSTLSASCDGLWRGIRVYQGGELFVEEAIIKDALYAIRPFNLPTAASVGNPKLDIIDMVFEDNFIGLFAIDGRFDLDHFNNNHFLGGNILPINNNSCPNLVNDIASINYPVLGVSYGGIFVDGSPWYLQPHMNGAQLIMPNSASGNLFENLSCGINVRSSSNLIQGCDFLDIDKNTYTTDAGFGIVSISGTSFNVKGGAFNNVRIGIMGSSAGSSTAFASIKNTTMNNVLGGITLQSSPWGNYGSANVQQNDIFVNWPLGGGYGIFIKDPSPASSFYRIQSNYISLNHDNSYGIWMMVNNGGVSGQVGPSLMSNVGNVIDVNPNAVYSKAFHFNGATDLEIASNSVDFLTESGGFGFNVLGGSDLSFSCNTISQFSPSQNGAVGINLIGSDRFSIDHTSLSDTKIGMVFDMPCDQPNNISQNHFSGTMQYGLYYQQDAFIGNQPGKGNVWDGTYTSWGAINTGAYGPNIYHTYPGNNQTPPSVYPFSGWFLAGADVEITYCEAKPPVEGLAQGLTSYQLDYAKGNIKSEQIGADWEMKKQIILKLKNGAYASDLDVFVFYTEQAPLMAMIQVENQIKDLFEISSENQEAINSLNAEILSMMNKLDEFDTQLKMEPTNYNLLVDYDLVQQELASMQEALSNVWQEVYETRSTKSKPIVEELATMSDESLPQAIASKVWAYYLKYQAQNLPLSNEELDYLKKMANYCPEKGGNAVFFAADLYTIITNEPLPVGDCSKGGKSEIKAMSGNTTTTLAIYPNPGTSSLTITQVGEEELTIQVVDMTGQVLISKKSYDKNTSINTNGLARGFYIIDVKSPDGLVNHSLKWLKN